MQLSVAQWRPGGYVGGGRPWGWTLVIGGLEFPPVAGHFHKERVWCPRMDAACGEGVLLGGNRPRRKFSDEFKRGWGDRSKWTVVSGGSVGVGVGRGVVVWGW